MPFFPEEAFINFVKQCKNHTVETQGGEWEFYVKSPDFTVYRKPAHDRNPNLYQYRSMGGWKDVHPDTLAHVYLDLDFRKKWDKNMQSHQYFVIPPEENDDDDFDNSGGGHSGNHFEMKYPWPLSNRDYAYTIERKLIKDKEEGTKYQVILGESLPSTSFPQKKGVIRIDTYMQNICITAGKDGKGSYVFMDYFDDPKGNIPKSVINWAAKTGVPSFINSLKAACIQYEKEHPEGVPLNHSEVLYL